MAISQITAASIADGTVVASDIAANSITTVKIADGNVTNAKIDSVANTKITGTVLVSQGGTGQSSFTAGQVLIGNTASGGLDKTTLTAGTGTSITNANGSISIAPATGYNGFGARTVSTGTPTGGSDGDIWYKYS